MYGETRFEGPGGGHRGAAEGRIPDGGLYPGLRRGVESAGETWYMNARYVEAYVGSGDTLTMNLFQQDPDIFYVTRTGDTYSASFQSGIMVTAYGNSVPNSWLMTMPYITPGVLNGDGGKVRIIAPHNQGPQTAAGSVYPAFYEITITKMKNQN